ncbi:MAG: glutathione peroxidase [Phycisphaerae bacterium]
MTRVLGAAVIVLVLGTATAQQSEPPTPKPAPAATGEESRAASDAPATTQPATRPVSAERARSPLDFTLADIDGNNVELGRFKGRVVMIVNTASKCGMTPQYEQLNELYTRYKDRGLTVLAFPANDFREQEPGTNAEIKEFCTSKYSVAFPLFAKVSVKGPEMCELYKFLTSPDRNGEYGSPIQWNFTKFLVGRDGKVCARFEPRTKPDAPEVVAAIEAALREKTPAKP